MLKNAIALFILAVVILAIFLPAYTTMQDLKAKNRQFAERIAELEARNKQYEQERHLLLTDPAYVEKIGREKMGLIKPGETVYRIVPEQQK